MVNKFHMPSFWGGDKTQKPILNQAIADKNAALDDAYNFQNQNQQPPPADADELKKKVKK